MILLAPTVAASEAAADCEETQPWIGYRTTDQARSILKPILADAGLDADACEGEQWDGQDAIAGGDTTSYGMGADPNGAPGEDLLQPAGARVTSRGASEHYAAANVAFVARAAIYVGTCGSGDAGLEGEASCGAAREVRTGVYYRDNTPSNLVTQLQPQCLLRLTRCWPAEQDCDQATYQRSAYFPPTQCARDNTAITAEFEVLP